MLPVAEEKIISFLRYCCFGGEFDKSQVDSEFFALLNRYELDTFAFYYLRDLIPDDCKDSILEKYHCANALDFRFESMYLALKKLLVKNQVRFVPVKGADLSWRVYPTGFLRQKCDLDVVVHTDDIERCVKILVADGWKMPYDYQASEHLPQLVKNRVPLELHHRLPYFQARMASEYWPFLELQADGSYQLPLEINLLLLFRHCRQHQWSDGLKLLLDFGYLLKNYKIDWNKLYDFSKLFQVPSPDILFVAFPDFFPADLAYEQRFTDDEAKEFRELILTNFKTWREDSHTFIMNTRDRFSWEWWKKRVSGMSPRSIRLQTHNPRGRYGKLILGYFQVGFRKLSSFCHGLFHKPDTELMTRSKRCHAIDTMLDNRLEQNALPRSCVPVPKIEDDFYDWWQRHQKCLRLVAEKQYDIILFGDSLTHCWNNDDEKFCRGRSAWQSLFGDLAVLNLGFGFDRTQNLLWRLRNGEIANQNPRLAVLCIGTNQFSKTANYSGDTPEVAAQGINAVITELREKFPKTYLIIMALFPRSGMADLMIKTNKLVKDFVSTCKNTEFVDIFSLLADKNGEPKREFYVANDGTHIGDAGYQVWADAIKPIIDSRL